MEKKGTYLVGIDIIRVIACFMIFAFHTRGILGLSYGFLNKYVDQGAIFCSVFFMLSGFSLYLSHSKKDLMQIIEIKSFYVKRIIGIMPVFIITWSVYYLLLGGNEGVPLGNILRLLPIDFLGIRCELLYLPGMNFFWYISCLIIGYIVYPFIQTIVKQLKIRENLVLVVIIFFILCYSKYSEEYFGTSAMTYYVPFFRVLQIMIGAICGRIMQYINESCFIKGTILVKIKMTILVVSVLAFVYFYNYFLKFGNRWMWYDVFIIPCIMCVLICIDSIQVPKGILQDVIKFFAGITYEIYLFQIWVIQIFSETGKGRNYYVLHSNRWRVVIVWTSVIFISYFFNRLIRLITKKKKYM